MPTPLSRPVIGHRLRVLAVAAGLAAALGGCTVYDNMVYGNRPGTIERPGSAAGPNEPAIYVVARGDTVDGIAKRFNIPPQVLIERNSLKPPYAISVGQWLEVPNQGGEMADTGMVSGGTSAGGSPAPVRGGAVQSTELAPVAGTGGGAPPAQVAPAQPPASTGAPAPLSSAPTKPQAPPATEQASRTASPPAPAATRPTTGIKFDWPVRGPILASFGQKPGGVQNDGIDIGAAPGTPVKAAEAGSVLYAGDEVKGFGKLVLIGHADGYVTAYAHNEEILVAKGAHVAKGQVIAKVGQTGNVTSPRLHFEIRQLNKPVDPAPLLGP